MVATTMNGTMDLSVTANWPLWSQSIGHSTLVIAIHWSIYPCDRNPLVHLPFEGLIIFMAIIHWSVHRCDFHLKVLSSSRFIGLIIVIIHFTTWKSSDLHGHNPLVRSSLWFSFEGLIVVIIHRCDFHLKVRSSSWSIGPFVIRGSTQSTVIHSWSQSIGLFIVATIIWRSIQSIGLFIVVIVIWRSIQSIGPFIIAIIILMTNQMVNWPMNYDHKG